MEKDTALISIERLNQLQKYEEAILNRTTVTKILENHSYRCSSIVVGQVFFVDEDDEVAELIKQHDEKIKSYEDKVDVITTYLEANNAYYSYLDKVVKKPKNKKWYQFFK